MYKQLIEDISYDLNIQKYSTEEDELYHSRIVYSAISLWMKYIILDHMIHKDKAEVKSKNYHYRRSAELLDEYTTLIPEISYWIYPDNNIDPVHIIRNRLIAAGEINEFDLDGNITIAKKKIIPVDENISRLIDISSYNADFKYVGITKIIKEMNEEGSVLLNKNSIDAVKEISNPSIYHKIPRIDFRYEVLNVYKKNKYEKIWIPNGYLDSEINLIRKETERVNYWDYLLVLNQSDSLFQYPLKEELVKQGFHNRLILGLRQIYENPVKAKYKKHRDIVELNLGIKLPRFEESLLTTFSWPKNHILDSWSFIVPIELWGRMTTILETLGYKLEES